MRNLHLNFILTICLSLTSSLVFGQTATTATSGASPLINISGSNYQGYCLEYHNTPPGSGDSYVWDTTIEDINLPGVTACLMGHANYGTNAVQRCVWYFTDGINPPSGNAGWTIIQNVNNGTYYDQCASEWYPKTSGQQDMMTHNDPHCHPVALPSPCNADLGSNLNLCNGPVTLSPEGCGGTSCTTPDLSNSHTTSHGLSVFNNANIKVGGATVTGSRVFTGSASLDEDMITDDQTTGIFGISQGVQNSFGANDAMINTYTFSQDVCDFEIDLWDIDQYDEMVLHAFNGNTPVSYTVKNVGSCVNVSGNTFNSACATQAGSNYSGFKFTADFDGCIDKIVIRYYDYSTSQAGGSYTLSFGEGCTGGNCSYSWSNNQSSQSIIASTPGTYCVTISNSNGCKDTDCVTISACNNCPISVDIGNNKSFCQVPMIALNAVVSNVNECPSSTCGDVLASFSGDCDDPNDCLVNSYSASCIGNISDICPTNGANNASCNNGIICIASNYNSWEVTIPAEQTFTFESLRGDFLYSTTGVNQGGAPNSTNCPSSITLDVRFYIDGTHVNTRSYTLSANNLSTLNLSPSSDIVVSTGQELRVVVDPVASGDHCDLVDVTNAHVIGCCGDNSVVANNSYQWSGPGVNGATTSSVLIHDFGTYSVTVTDCGGCQAVDQLVISQDSGSIDIDLGPDQSKCPDDGPLALTPTVTGASTCAPDFDCNTTLVSYLSNCDDPSDCLLPSNTESCLSFASGVCPTNGPNPYASCNNNIICIASNYNSWEFLLTASQNVEVNEIVAVFWYPTDGTSAGGVGNSPSCPTSFTVTAKFYRGNTLVATENVTIPENQVITTSIEPSNPIALSQGHTLRVELSGNASSDDCDLIEIASLWINGCCNPVDPIPVEDNTFM